MVKQVHEQGAEPDGNLASLHRPQRHVVEEPPEPKNIVFRSTASL
jgi:hypothetical protein